MQKRFIVGIDLGTTNCSVSYVDLGDNNINKYNINTFRIPQLTGLGKFSSLQVLPSFLYIPGKYDMSDSDIKTPWKIEDRSVEDKNFVGKFARDYGVKIPSRLVSSAKSWLCNKSVDRKARILPWGAKNEDVLKISPLRASASYLEHIRKAWNIAHKNDDSLYLENQTVIITVPASFDQVARDLTLESANMAGLFNVLLLEEPLAAFYSWLSENEKNWLSKIEPNQLILVCDVGGGTTDFSLIYLKNIGTKKFRFERLAVGDHLILGGDNIDFIIAKKVAKKIYKNYDLMTNDNWNNLCYQCRKIKEKILDRKENSGRITIIGSGSSLISDSLVYDINLEEIENIIFEDFFPSNRKKSKHFDVYEEIATEKSLLYEKNISITYHLENFIEQNKLEIKKLLNSNKICPDFVLFNGGTLKPYSIQKKIISFLSARFGNSRNKPRIIKNKHINSAVSIGASYYGLVKNGYGISVGSGSSRAFYIGVQDKIDLKQSICLVERGLEEGSTISLPKKQFKVLANQPISIQIYSSSFRSGDSCGDVVTVDDTLTPLPPICTVIKFGEKGINSKISINIEATYTEVGTLELWCKSIATSHKWQLKFQLRNNRCSSGISEAEIFDHTKMKLAHKIVKVAFSPNQDNLKLSTLVKDISKIFGRSKDEWSLGIIRNLCDITLEHIDIRKLSFDLENRWMNFIGFCLRPGLGDGFDSYRIKKIWKFYKQGPIHYKNLQIKLEWWILWRRIAAGLNSGQQLQFIQDIKPLLMGKKNHKCSKQERIELWMSAANMERLNVKDKIELGRHLLSEINPNKVKPQLLWALSRIGAREPLYSFIDRVIDQREITTWLLKIISVQWSNPKPVIEMVTSLGQKTGDQLRDIKSDLRNEINKWINSFGMFPKNIKKINEIVRTRKDEQNIIFGDSIPTGIILKSKQ